MPATTAVVRATVRSNPDLDRHAVLALVDRLWGKGVHELRMAAVGLLERYLSRLDPSDVDLVERLIREAKTWALVDELAAVIAGGLVERSPALTAKLDRWARDDDFWLRRAAMLALLLPLRRGDGDFDRFARYADAMLDEREFFIRKAIGWVLRETGKKRPELVWEWLAPRTARASGVTVREAVRYLPEGQRAAILAAYKSKRPAR
ncbi:MAG: DNA alkylation repair protein [Dehalococcoidia bacterium]